MYVGCDGMPNLTTPHVFTPNPSALMWCAVCEQGEDELMEGGGRLHIPGTGVPVVRFEDHKEHQYRGVRGGRCEVCDAKEEHSIHDSRRRLPVSRASAPEMVPLVVKVPRRLLNRIEEYRRAQDKIPTRAAAVRELIEKGLAGGRA